MEKRLVKLVENPMLKAFGKHADPDLICYSCKHMGSTSAKLGLSKGSVFPACSLRGAKPHNPEWPACGKFLTWQEWRKQRDEQAARGDSA